MTAIRRGGALLWLCVVSVLLFSTSRRCFSNFETNKKIRVWDFFFFFSFSVTIVSSNFERREQRKNQKGDGKIGMRGVGCVFVPQRRCFFIIIIFIMLCVCVCLFVFRFAFWLSINVEKSKKREQINLVGMLRFVFVFPFFVDECKRFRRLIGICFNW